MEDTTPSIVIGPQPRVSLGATIPSPWHTAGRGPLSVSLAYTSPSEPVRADVGDAPGLGADMTADRDAQTDALSQHLLAIATEAARDAGAYFAPFAGRIKPCRADC